MTDFLTLMISFSPFILIILVILAIVFALFKMKTKSTLKPIARDEVERLRFIKKMEINKNQYDFKYLYRGKDCIGKIISSKGYRIKINNGEHLIFNFVVKPMMFKSFEKPFGKEKAVQINYANIKGNEVEIIPSLDKDKFILPKWVHFEYYFGIYYDNTLEKEHTFLIKNNDVALSDLQDLASVYFVKAQEMSTFDPERAGKMALKERELEIELAKKRGEQQSV